MNIKDWQSACARIKAQCLNLVQNETQILKLEEIKVKYLGRKGELTELLKLIKDFSPEDKRIAGPLGNSFKDELTSLIESRLKELNEAELAKKLEAETLDLSLPAFPIPRGHYHLLTFAIRRMTNILLSMGFNWEEGPHVEEDFYNFDALNTPKNHPSRDSHDTLYVDLGSPVRKLLRSHTSSVQIRTMQKRKPPIRIIAMGRAFRNDSIDATHSPVFHQIEGLYVDKKVSLADLKATLTLFMKGLFGDKAEVRFRPSFFPFVEPGVEVDVKCIFCEQGKHCPVCKGSQWLEMLGAGIVHPNVFTACGIDPLEYTGFAFGMGVERLTMLSLGIKDIRVFYENDLRILRQF